MITRKKGTSKNGALVLAGGLLLSTLTSFCGPLPQERTPPGAQQWHMPTRDMPMVFQKRTPRQLCEQLKNPAQNGGRNLEEVLEHVREAPLVLWGWKPGNRRTPAPGSHDEFVRVMTEWVKGGAACPE